ncbi:Autophagy-related protein 3 [Arabidopsis suecica]|uniref:Ubiquitin-like-conjugating enzyme ATG10 n=1 Tax=Arabidopsis suecica TaxID=45249 RepID=A0A8T2B855_ARASU|nr:Autophagy-related protein 3 [Arabidopsis suecica]
MDSAREVSDGRLTVEGFSVAARTFADKWMIHNQAFPPWSWIPLINRTLLVSNKQEEGYLSLEKIIILSSLDEIPEDESLNVATDCLEKEESIDHTILVPTLENEAHYYDFHIVHSASYKVPVLYFRGYCSGMPELNRNFVVYSFVWFENHLCCHLGGQPLSLDVIRKDLPSCSVSLLVESKWTFITQEASSQNQYYNVRLKYLFFVYLVLNFYATINCRSIRI